MSVYISPLQLVPIEHKDWPGDEGCMVWADNHDSLVRFCRRLKINPLWDARWHKGVMHFTTGERTRASWAGAITKTKDVPEYVEATKQ